MSCPSRHGWGNGTCGAPVVWSGKGRKPVYCSDRCRKVSHVRTALDAAAQAAEDLRAAASAEARLHPVVAAWVKACNAAGIWPSPEQVMRASASLRQGSLVG